VASKYLSAFNSRATNAAGFEMVGTNEGILGQRVFFAICTLKEINPLMSVRFS
jgi:hypothetical protein